jgi:hypothetical protein
MTIKEFTFYEKNGDYIFSIQALDHKQACFLLNIPEDTDYEVTELYEEDLEDSPSIRESERKYQESNFSVEFNRSNNEL